MFAGCSSKTVVTPLDPLVEPTAFTRTTSRTSPAAVLSRDGNLDRLMGCLASIPWIGTLLILIAATADWFFHYDAQMSVLLGVPVLLGLGMITAGLPIAVIAHFDRSLRRSATHPGIVSLTGTVAGAVTCAVLIFLPRSV